MFVKAIGYLLVIFGLTMFVAAVDCNELILILAYSLGGIVPLSLGILLIKKGPIEAQKANRSNYLMQKETFIAKSNKIKVDLLSCKIKRYDYVEERAFSNSEYNSITYNPTNQWSGDMLREEKLRAVVLFNTEINGVMREFRSPIIEKDEITLRFLLGNQQETYLYIDNSDNNNYLFDFDFIKDKYD